MRKTRVRILKRFFLSKVGRTPTRSEERKLKRMHMASVRNGEWAKFVRSARA